MRISEKRIRTFGIEIPYGGNGGFIAIGRAEIDDDEDEITITVWMPNDTQTVTIKVDALEQLVAYYRSGKS